VSDSIAVIGGAGGLEVEYDDLDGAAAALQAAALDLTGSAFAARHVLTDPGLAASALLDPSGFARVEAAVLAAVLGPHGLAATAARLEEESLALRAAVLRYAAADRLRGWPGLTFSLDVAAGLLANAYPAGTPVVVGRGTDSSAPPPSRSVTGLLVALDHRDRSSQGDAQGEIDVRRLTCVDPDGSVHTSWIVDLPGTKAWQLDPCNRDYLNDLATNLATMAGSPSARVDGVTRALTLAGVGPDEPVMLVGHSQGGLVAMRAAEDYARTGAFAVTHVVTAGAPIARMPVPPSVSVLALENSSDLVPRLDGEPPPPEPNRVTVVFDLQRHDVGRNHSLTDAYLPGARAVDGDMADPSLATWRRGAAAFLPSAGDQAEVSTTVWDIRNGS
jgi:pimeloyl-ACP methyl ester carboxylesterase